MDGMKSGMRLSPEILGECLNEESCFGTIKHERDITLTLNNIASEFRNAKYIGKFSFDCRCSFVYIYRFVVDVDSTTQKK